MLYYVLGEVEPAYPPFSFPFPVLLCQSILPQLFGLSRSLGRFGSGRDFLLSRLYPPRKTGIAAAAAAAAQANGHGGGGGMGQSHHEANGIRPRAFSNFRSIIPRSLSMTFETNRDFIPSGSQESLVDLRYLRHIMNILDSPTSIGITIGAHHW